MKLEMMKSSMVDKDVENCTFKPNINHKMQRQGKTGEDLKVHSKSVEKYLHISTIQKFVYSHKRATKNKWNRCQLHSIFEAKRDFSHFLHLI